MLVKELLKAELHVVGDAIGAWLVFRVAVDGKRLGGGVLAHLGATGTPANAHRGAGGALNSPEIEQAEDSECCDIG